MLRVLALADVARAAEEEAGVVRRPVILIDRVAPDAKAALTVHGVHEREESEASREGKLLALGPRDTVVPQVRGEHVTAFAKQPW